MQRQPSAGPGPTWSHLRHASRTQAPGVFNAVLQFKEADAPAAAAEPIALAVLQCADPAEMVASIQSSASHDDFAAKARCRRRRRARRGLQRR